ncbi:MAG: hypothetical protein ACF8QF_05585 [Phycisphaerales bacterium]
MALFGKKKGPADGDGSGDGGGGATGPFQPDPGKAARWFEHARTQHETANYEYAVTCWLKGLAFDPANQDALQGFLNSAQAFASGQKKPGPSKDQVKSFGGKTPVDRFVQGLLMWGTTPQLSNVGAGVKAVESAASLGLADSAKWIGERTIARAKQAEPKKDHFVRLKEAFVDIEAFRLAQQAGEAALQIDPNDAALNDEVRNLAAQAAMSSGGYEESGEEGGFRKNIKDAEAQKRLREQASVVRTEDATERIVQEAKADYESRPGDTHAIGRYVKALLERAASDDEQTVLDILKKAYEDTREFRWRQQMGDLEIRRERRNLAALKRKIEENGGDEALKEQFKKAQRALLESEAEEFRVRVEAYPTDARLKYELGRRLFALDQAQEAIKYLQEAQADAKIRTGVQSVLGQAFERLGWHGEAADMLRQALDNHANPNDDLGMDLRYGLMVALENKAKADGDVASAEEASKIASSLAMQKIDFRDVVDRRQSLQKLVQELRTAG